MTLKAFDSMGQEMKPGDTMLDFHGERAVLVKATRARTPRRSGKVVVTWVGDNKQQEVYDRVFDLAVKDIPD